MTGTSAPQQSATGASGHPAAVASSQPSRPDPQAIDDLVARIAQRESLDPAAKARLAEDLRQTDPALWPALMQYFQAALAYKRQAEEKQAASPGQASASPAGPSPGTPTMPNASAAANLSNSQQAVAAQPRSGVEPERTAAQAAPLPSPVAAQPPELLRSHPRTDSGASAAMPVAGADRPPPSAPGSDSPRPDAERSRQKPDSRAQSSETAAGGEVVAAAYTASASAGSAPWQERLEGVIKLLESEARQSPQSAADLYRQARLRLLCLAAGRREDALRAIQPASPAMQDSWSQMIYGVATWMDTERIPDSGLRAAETRQQLTAAVNRLGELAPLVVRNTSLVKEVKGYGDLVPFEKTEFSPGQEVILYAEVENFKSEETPKGFRTGFHGSYEIFDARGQRVTTQELGNTDEHCRNQRRDFYLNYLFRLPKRIYGGRHTLKLTVEDLHGKKIGQSSVEFTVKASGE